ncbi:MoaD/ThiS family protein [Stygiolobus caldivivus]|uniref:Ubiquitin n=1 Tax=Stygiolobus caldivivus TaxID=2824673 RepID=A0A8D5U8A1_9CREN|nr:MoaD/ThiS family protein [Stygiolobus caldivivus]BCU70584.1 hypothetical protein KN1_18810 [Stygiolobus caldivivus]
MPLTVVLRGPLVTTYGFEKITYDGEYTIQEIIKKIDNNKNIIYDNKVGNIKSGYIILVNGKDYRLLKNHVIKDNDLIEIIPINHGG